MTKNFEVIIKREKPLFNRKKLSLSLDGEVKAHISFHKRLTSPKTIFVDYWTGETPYAAGKVLKVFKEYVANKKISKIEAEVHKSLYQSLKHEGLYLDNRTVSKLHPANILYLLGFCDEKPSSFLNALDPGYFPVAIKLKE